MYARFLGSYRWGIAARLSRTPTRCSKVVGFWENKNIEKMISFNLRRVIRCIHKPLGKGSGFYYIYQKKERKENTNRSSKKGLVVWDWRWWDDGGTWAKAPRETQNVGNCVEWRVCVSSPPAPRTLDSAHEWCWNDSMRHGHLSLLPPSQAPRTLPET